MHPDIRCRGSSLALDALRFIDGYEQRDMLEKLSDAHVTVICKRQCQSLDEKLAAFELISATEPG